MPGSYSLKSCACHSHALWRTSQIPDCHYCKAPGDDQTNVGTASRHCPPQPPPRHPILCHSPAKTKLSCEESDSQGGPRLCGAWILHNLESLLRENNTKLQRERVIRNLIFKSYDRNENKFQILKSWQNTKRSTLSRKQDNFKLTAWHISEIHSPTFLAVWFLVASSYDNDFVKSFCLKNIER